jgi:hypothetical protein
MTNETKTTPSKGKQLHATTSTIAEIDSTEHAIDAELTTNSEDEMAVWGYLMTQYLNQDYANSAREERRQQCRS